MKHIELNYLAYFLDSYWNQMGKDIYGEIDGAAAAFSSESDEFRKGLIGDLTEALRSGLLADNFRDPIYKTIYWSKFQRCINKSDARIIRQVLESRS